jgi:sec-independent protein translocase protein TatC
MQYILEIKNRLTLLFVSWFSTILTTYTYKETLLFIIVQPYTSMSIKESMNISYFIFTDVTEILSVYLSLVMFVSFQILYAYIAYHFFLFLSPALFYMEYLFCKVGLATMAIMWAISIILSTYVLIPVTWHFLLSFQNLSLRHSLNLHFEAKLKEYLHFFMSSYFMYTCYFQFFTFFFLSLNYAHFSVQKLKDLRKFNYYCFVIAATAISPPEIINQLCMGFIAILIYEFTLFIYLLKTHR